MRILYVEDNPANVFLVKRVAKMGNHEIINYIDGDQALSKFAELDPDLVLMDIQLAGEKSGLDVVRELRKRGTDVPVIAVTAYAMVGDRERCIEAGCTDYLAKPLPIPRLVEIFQEYSDAAKNKSKTASEAPKEEPATTDETVKAEADKVSETSTQTVAGEAPVGEVTATSEAKSEVKSDDETLPESPIAEASTTSDATTDAETSTESTEEGDKETETATSVSTSKNVEEQK